MELQLWFQKCYVFKVVKHSEDGIESSSQYCFDSGLRKNLNINKIDILVQDS